MKLKYNSYNDLTINKFYELHEAMTSENDDIDKIVSVAAVLCDVDENTICDMNIGDIADLKEQLVWLNEEPDYNVKFKCKYIDLPNFGKCKIDANMKNFTISQYIDFQTFYKDIKTNPERLMSVVIIPEKHKYCEGYDAFELMEDIRNNVDIITAKQICFFIVSRLVNSIVNTLTCLENNLMAKKILTWKKSKRKELQQHINQLRATKEMVRTLGCV